MRFGIKTLDDFEKNDGLRGKTVLCRVDINQPVDRAKGTLKSINRIQACVPTTRELSEKGARVVLMAHQGSDIEYKNYYTTKPHAEVLSRLLGFEVKWVEDVCGPTARNAIESLNDGEVLLLDNVRFMAEEQTLFETKLCLSHEDQAKTQVVTKLAPLGDLYVCDAFAAAHRDQPTLCGFEQILPSAMGRLFEKEYCTVSSLMEEPERPCVFVLGGAKIADAFQMMKTVLSKGSADLDLTGGLVAKLITDVPGSSDVFEGSVVSYSNDVKTDMLGVDDEVLDDYGAVSHKVAILMAEGVRRRMHTDWAIGITGIAGPGGGTPDKPVGLVYVAIVSRMRSRVLKFNIDGNRDMIRNSVAKYALRELLVRIIKRERRKEKEEEE